MKRMLILFLTIMSFITVTVLAEDVDYSIPRYTGNLRLKEDNTASFEQRIQYQFESDYHGQYVTLGSAGKMPKNFEIGEQPLVAVTHNGQLVESRSEIFRLDEGYRLKIYNNGSSGDRVEITIIWQLKNLLNVYKDVAELNWIPISDWDRTIDVVEFSLDTEKPIENSQLWAHKGYMNDIPKVSSYRPGSYQVIASDIDGRFELHSYWNRKELLLPNIRYSEQSKKDTILAQEKKIIATNTRKNFIFKKLIPRGILIVYLIYFVIFHVFKKRLKVFAKKNRRNHLYEAPEELSPLLLAQNIYGITFEDLSPISDSVSVKKAVISFENLLQATLLDLIDRKALAIKKETGLIELEIQNLENLADEETAFIEFAFGNESRLPINQLFKQYDYDKNTPKKLKKIYKGQKLESEVRKSSLRLLAALKSDLLY